MRVSVVIPMYNSGLLAAEAVESVLAQSRPADEIIVVDDGSTDDTPERLAWFVAPVRIIRKENGGVSSARNRGVDDATGDVIAFLDADDVWHPRKLEIQLAALAARPELGMLGTGVYTWPADAHPRIGAGVESRLDAVRLDDLLVCNHLITSAIVARADVLRSAGSFDSRLQGPEDHDLWIRVAKIARVGSLQAPLTGYRGSTPGSLSKNAERMEVGMRAILDKLESQGLYRGRPLLRRKAWSHFRYSCGLMYRAAGELGTAADRFARSLTNWPLPLTGRPGQSVRRSRALARTLWSMLKGGKPLPDGA